MSRLGINRDATAENVMRLQKEVTWLNSRIPLVLLVNARDHVLILRGQVEDDPSAVSLRAKLEEELDRVSMRLHKGILSWEEKHNMLFAMNGTRVLTVLVGEDGVKDIPKQSAQHGYPNSQQKSWEGPGQYVPRPQPPRAHTANATSRTPDIDFRNDFQNSYQRESPLARMSQEYEAELEHAGGHREKLEREVPQRGGARGRASSNRVIDFNERNPNKAIHSSVSGDNKKTPPVKRVAFGRSVPDQQSGHRGASDGANKTTPRQQGPGYAYNRSPRLGAASTSKRAGAPQSWGSENQRRSSSERRRPQSAGAPKRATPGSGSSQRMTTAEALNIGVHISHYVTISFDPDPNVMCLMLG